MEFEELLNEADKLQDEINLLQNKLSVKASLFNNFFNKVFATGDSTEKVLVKMESGYNNTKQNVTNTEPGQLTIVDDINKNINKKEIPYEESIVNEVI